MGLRPIYSPGFELAKAGVMLLELQDSAYEQLELNLEDDKTADRSKLMMAMDVVNQRFGKGACTWPVLVWMVTSGFGQ